MDTALQMAATGMAGIFAGVALHETASSHPARMELDAANGRRHWVVSYWRSRRYLRLLCAAGSLAGLAAYVTSLRKLWLLGSMVIAITYPWTRIFMELDIKQLLKDNVIKNYGDDRVQEHMKRFDSLHRVRTCIGMSAFAVYLYALAKRH